MVGVFCLVALLTPILGDSVVCVFRRLMPVIIYLKRIVCIFSTPPSPVSRITGLFDLCSCNTPSLIVIVDRRFEVCHVCSFIVLVFGIVLDYFCIAFLNFWLTNVS